MAPEDTNPLPNIVPVVVQGGWQSRQSLGRSEENGRSQGVYRHKERVNENFTFVPVTAAAG